MANILAVGIATLDIVNTVERYPAEDAEVRAIAQQRRRGGNATNTLVVLSQLGHRCSWAGTIADEPDSRFILDDLARHTIDTAHVRHLPDGKVPTSYVTLSSDSGSRTIVHYRDLPEYAAAWFETIDLTPFGWVHFEGRHVTDTQRMLAHLRLHWPALPCSVEVEKPREAIETLFPCADLLLFSRAYAAARGMASAAELFAAVRPHAPQAELVCGWGAAGAYGATRAGELLFAPAASPTREIDTLAAGDVFNAAVIDGRVRGLGLEASLTAATELAGRKCGQEGLDNLLRTGR